MLPPEIVTQRKRTFTFPWDNWLRGTLQKRVGEGLADWSPALAAQVDGNFALQIWKDFQAGRTSWSRPWSLFVLNEWAKRHLCTSAPEHADRQSAGAARVAMSDFTRQRGFEPEPMIILGINAYHANASAAIVVDGQLIAAVEEERLNRVKYAAGLPARAIQFCLDRAGAKLPKSITSPFRAIPRARLGTKLRFAARMPRFALDRFRVMKRFAGMREDLAAVVRDRARKASARNFTASSTTPRTWPARITFRPSRMPRCFRPTAWAISPAPCGPLAKARACASGRNRFPHSLGMYYTALTQYLGFWKFGDEYKVMGLAAYGQPAFLDEFRKIVRADRPLSFKLGLEYFTHQARAPEMSWRDADQHAGSGPPFFLVSRKDDSARRAKRTSRSTQRHHNLAASMQAALEEVVVAHWNALAAKPRSRKRCALRAESRSTAWRMEKFSITRRSSAFTCSPPRAMPAFRWAPRSP